MITVSDLSFNFGTQTLFKGVDLKFMNDTTLSHIWSVRPCHELTKSLTGQVRVMSQSQTYRQMVDLCPSAALKTTLTESCCEIVPEKLE